MSENNTEEISSVSTTDWDKDTQVLPRLQIIDENQKFT